MILFILRFQATGLHFSVFIVKNSDRQIKQQRNVSGAVGLSYIVGLVL